MNKQVRRLCVVVAVVLSLSVAYYALFVWPVLHRLSFAPESFPGLANVSFVGGYEKWVASEIKHRVYDATAPSPILKDSPYKTYSSGLNASRDLHDVFWLDNQRVIFNVRPLESGRDQFANDITIWTPGGGSSVYKRDATLRCFTDNRICYSVRTPDTNGGASVNYFCGVMGHETDQGSARKIGLDDMNCVPLREREDILVGKPGKFIKLLKTEHGYLDYGPTKVFHTAQQPNAVLVLSAGNVELPLKAILYIDYAPFKDAYLVRQIGDPENKAKVFWLYPDGQVERVQISQPWDEDMDLYITPSKQGFVYAGDDLRKPVMERKRGVFLLKGNSVEPLLREGVSGQDGLAVSPDGCRLAVKGTEIYKTNGKTTIYAIDLCKGETK